MTDYSKDPKSEIDRRSFIKRSGLALVGSSLVYPTSILEAKNRPQDSQLKVGLIGCGGRGTGAAVQALNADPGAILTAMGDVFEDRLEGAYTEIVKIAGNQVKVDKAHKFIGFDAYQKVLDSGVDVVLLTTPPGFRPDHLTAAINAGKHVFCEKPVAVDSPGVRKVLAAAKMAKEKSLSLVSGFCFRYDNAKRATFGKILNGDIGDINTITTFRNGGELWYKERQSDWSQMTYQMRNWYYYNWLSGDFIVEMAVHSLDLMAWAMGDVMPISAVGTGGRQARTHERYGNIYDHFAVEFEYANGARGYHFTRQQADTSRRNSVDIIGTNGTAKINVGRQYEIKSHDKSWKFDGERNNMYQTEHDELFAAIRSGKPHNDGVYMANSTLLGIWARMAAYTGLTISLDQALNSKESLGPKKEDYAWDYEWQMPSIAVPGKTKFV